ncbi:PAS domain S-box protein [Nannocystaceae bacterium ST9]
MNHDEDRNLVTLTLAPGAVTRHAARTHAEELIATLDLDAAPISIRERITLRGLHSSGGIGEVWRAYDEVLGREIALKRLKSDKAGSEANRARFLREARITGQLDHPGIVPVYDYSSNHDGTHCFYTMRFLRGRTLREVIAEFHRQRRAEQLPLVSGGFLQLLGYFASICNTMAFAHSRQIIHRDLKGDNVIIGDFGEVVVLDWGLAKQLDADPYDDQGPALELDELSATETLQGEQLGTPAYMAPEQATGQIDQIDHRTDVYGLAAILYEILTGRPPFAGTDVAKVLDAVVAKPPIPPHERVADVPVELEQICLQGLAKAKADRPASVGELAGRVQGWLDLLAEHKRTEQERERFFDLSLDLLAILDREGRFSQSNAAWSDSLGWPSEARADADFLEFVDPEDRPIAARALAEIHTGAERASFEARMRSAAGPTCWVHWNVRDIPAERASYLVGRDIGERKQAEQEFRGLLESAPDAMIVVDQQGRIDLANLQVEAMFGYSRAELIGQSIEILLPERLRLAHTGHMLRYATAPQRRTMGEGRQLHARHRDGHEFAVDISLSPVEGKHGTRVCCALRAREPSPS